MNSLGEWGDLDDDVITDLGNATEVVDDPRHRCLLRRSTTARSTSSCAR